MGLHGRASRAVIPLLPVIAVFFAALLVLANIIEQRTQFQIEIAETSAGVSGVRQSTPLTSAANPGCRLRKVTPMLCLP